MGILRSVILGRQGYANFEHAAARAWNCGPPKQKLEMPRTGRPRKHAAKEAKAKHDPITRRARRKRKAATRDHIRFRIYTRDTTQATPDIHLTQARAPGVNRLDVLADVAVAARHPAHVGQSVHHPLRPCSQTAAIGPCNSASPGQTRQYDSTLHSRTESEMEYVPSEELSNEEEAPLFVDDEYIEFPGGATGGSISLDGESADQLGAANEEITFEEEDRTEYWDIILPCQVSADASIDESSESGGSNSEDHISEENCNSAPGDTRALARSFLEKRWTRQCNCTHEPVMNVVNGPEYTLADMANY